MKRLILIALALFISACATPKVENNADAYYNRGNAYFGKRQYDQAISDYDKAIELNPRDANAYYNRGNAYKRKGQYDQAISDYDKAIELNPRDAMAYFNRGYAYVRKRQYDQAISDYSKAIEINPRYAIAYVYRGAAYYFKGEHDRAISDYNKAIEVNPSNYMAYTNRGEAYRKKGVYDRAISDFDKAIELNSRNAKAYNNLAWLLATCPDRRYRNGARAVDLAQTAVELGNSFARMDTLAAAYAENGNFEEAIKTQEAAIAMLKHNADIKNLTEVREHLESYKSHRPWREPKAPGGNP